LTKVSSYARIFCDFSTTSPRLRRPRWGASHEVCSLTAALTSARITPIRIRLSHNPFRCNTYALPRKCCKQRTYGVAKPFSCNTYKETGGGVVIMVSQILRTSEPLLPLLCASVPLRLLRLPSSVHTSKFRIPHLLSSPLLRKLAGCVPKIPNLELPSSLQVEGRSCILAANPKGPATIPGNSSREKKQ
jgi:hypothetical protein